MAREAGPCPGRRPGAHVSLPLYTFIYYSVNIHINVLQILAVIANLLVLVALVYAVAAAVLLIWPHTLLKVCMHD